MTSAEQIVSLDSRLMSPPISVTPCSACCVLSAPLLTFLHDLIHVPRWPNLENVAVLQGRMLADELYSMIHVPRLKDEYAAELFFGFGIGAVCSRHFAVLPIQGQGGLWPLKRFSTDPVAAGAKMVIIFKACVEHGVSLGLSHAVEFAFVVVAKTEVFHCFSPHSGLAEPAAESCAGSVHLVTTVRVVTTARSAAVARLFSCLRRILIPEPGRKEARAPRPPHRWRWQPSSPMQVPHPYWRLPVSRNRPCAPWSRCMAHR